MRNMAQQEKYSVQELCKEIQEREKKLTCLYKIEQLFAAEMTVEKA